MEIGKNISNQYRYRNYFRIIVAGGGTGGVTVFMGEQLNHTNGEIVYLDFSKTSMHISQKRAKIRGLQHIIWIRNWIEAVRFLGMGSFEELQCSGVLHHLKRPSYGLNILKDSLTESGGMAIMVYGKFGRTAIYQTQDLLKMINSNQTGIEMELENAVHTLKILPDHNWFILNEVVGDHKHGKIGIYDLLLHKRDVAFSIKTLFEWITKSGLHFVDFDYYKKRYYLKTQYVIPDSTLLRAVFRLDRITNLCIAEIMRGHVFKQDFYTSKIQNSVADIQDVSNLMYLYGNPHGLRGAILNRKNRIVNGNETFFSAWMYRTNINQRHSNSSSNVYRQQVFNGPKIKFGWKLNTFNEFLVTQMLRSNKGVKLKTIHAEYRKTLEHDISDEALKRLSNDFYEYVKDTEMFLMKKEHVEPFPKTSFFNFILIQDT